MVQKDDYRAFAMGRRLIVAGPDTDQVRDVIEMFGGRYDGTTRRWWFPIERHRNVESLLGVLNSPPNKPAHEPGNSVTGDTPIVGRATYRGHDYLVLYEGETRHGYGIKLTSKDGELVFWAKNPTQVVIRRHSPLRFEEALTAGSVAVSR